MTPALGFLAAAAGVAAFVIEYLCSRGERSSRILGVALGTAIAFGAAVVIATLFGNHVAPRMPGMLPLAVWVGVALAPLVAVIRGRNRRA